MRSSPIQVGTGFYRILASGNNSTTAIDPYGTLSAWGENQYGQLGTTSITTYSWIQLSNGDTHSLALRSDKTLWSWGLNTSGQLGTSDTVARQSPIQISGSWLSVAAGASHSVGIKIDNTLYGWGFGTSGQVGDATTISRSSPVQIDTSAWSNVSAGNNFTLAIKTVDKSLWSWGNNNFYQLGSDTINRSSPIQVGTSSWLQISAGGSHALAIDTNNLLYGWGLNTSGQIGIKLFSWSQLSSGNGHSTAIRSDGRLYAWGTNTAGQLGQGNTLYRSSPVQVGTSSWTKVSAGQNQTLAIRSDNTLWGWGLNTNGQLGLTDLISRSSPVQVSGSWTSVYSGTFSALGIKVDNTLWAWGQNTQGQLGDGTTVAKSSPSQVVGSVTSWAGASISGSLAGAISTTGGLYLWGISVSNGTGFNASSPVQLGTSSWSAIAAGLSSMAGIDASGRLYTWGNNQQGEFGDNSASTVTRSSPVQIGTSSWITISAAAPVATVVGITIANVMWTWGNNSTFQLGDGSTVTSRSSMVQIGTGFLNAVAGNNLLALANSYNLFAWGNNTQGQLGLGDAVTRSFPTQIATLNDTLINVPLNIGTSSYSLVSAGQSHSAAITTDNILFTWGNNSNGQLGFAMSFPGITAGSSITSVIRSDGTLWVWGYNAQGQLGDNTTVNRSSPVQVGLLNNWSKTASGINSLTNYAITTLGKLYAWGDNTTGVIGDSTIVSKSSPVQIGNSSWTMIVAGGATTTTQSAYAIRSDGILFVWGDNSTGQLGINLGATPVPSPVQVGTSSWSTVTAGDRFAMAITVDGKLFGWGNNTAGQISVTTPSTFSWSKISTGNNHTLAIRNDNKLFAWGDNTGGKLGDGTTVTRSSPVLVTIGSFVQISAGLSNSYAITSDGALFAWGDNTNGQIPLIALARSSPVQVGTGGVNSVYFSGTGADYLTLPSSTAFGFGTGDFTVEYWVYSTSWAALPTVVDVRSTSASLQWSDNFSATGAPGMYYNAAQQLTSILSVSLNTWTHVAYTRSGSTISVWVNGALGASGTSSFDLQSTGTGRLGTNITVANSFTGYVSNVRIIKGQALFTNAFTPGTAALTTSTVGHTGAAASITGTVSLLTLQNSAIIDNSSNNFTITPIGTPRVDRLIIPFTQSSTTFDSWSQISASFSNNVILGLRSNSTLYAWGNNSAGQFGDGTTTNRNSPVLVLGGLSWNSVSTGFNHVLGISSTNKLYVWGTASLSVNSGQLGGVLPFSWSKISTGGNGTYHTLAIRNDGKLYAWGGNASGQLGSGLTTARSSPVQVGTDSWSQVSAGSNLSAAIRIDGALFTWGDNTSGQLGSNTTTNRSSPVQVGTDSWIQIDTNPTTNTIFGIRNDNTLWGWGVNNVYQLGIVDNINRSSPVQVSGGLSWNSVSSGNQHVLGISTTNKLYVWGGAPAGTEYGQFGTVLSFTWSKISTGGQHTLALRNDGKLYAWGLNTAGQLGQSDTIYRSSPVQVGTSSWSAVSAGLSSSYAIRGDGALFTWGDNTNGQLGSGLTTGRSSPVQVGTDSWSLVSASATVNYVIATLNTSLLYGWGLNSTNYQLGLNDTIDRSSPVQIGSGSFTKISAGAGHTLAIDSNNKLYGWGLNNVGQAPNVVSWTQVSMGQGFAIAIKANGTLWGWGLNTSVQLGQGDTVYRSSPVQIGAGLGSWTKISAGGGQSFAIRTDGTLWGWGSGVSGKLGTGDTLNRSSPVQIGTDTWNFIFAGPVNSTWGINSLGKLYAWGVGGSGILGLGDQVARSAPVQITTITSSWVAVASGGTAAFTGAITTDGKLFTWGTNTNGQLGLGDTIFRSNPVQLSGTTSWTTVAVGLSVMGGIDTTGRLFTWGSNAEGELGDATLIGGNRSSPVQVGSSSWSFLNAGGTVALTGNFFGIAGGSLYGWGDTQYGQLASTVVRLSTPTAIPGPVSFTQVFTNGSAIVGLGTTKSLYTWGYGGFGQLGIGDTLNRSSPVQVGTAGDNVTFSPVLIGNSSWTSIGAGQSHSLAIRSDGGLFGWGFNNAGQLGLNDTVNRPSPVQIGTSSWSAVSAGSSYTLALRSVDGALFTWGFGTQGQLGSGLTTARSSPVQVGTSSWSQVSAGTSTNVGIDINSNLYAWGLNTSGQVGDNTTANRSAPTQITPNYERYIVSPVIIGNSSWTSVATLVNHSLAIRSDGALFAWGFNNQGQLGLTNINAGGDTVNRSSPVQVGTSSWSAIATADVFSIAVRSDGALFTWGFGGSGQLGSGLTTARSSPVQVGTSSWSIVTTAGGIGVGIDTIGNLYGWGLNSSGQIGDNTIANRSAPTQITPTYETYIYSPTIIGSSSWSAVSAGYDHSVAIRSDGALFAWGNNIGGQLGLTNINAAGDTVNRSSPVQLSGTTSWSQIVTGRSYTVALRYTDGALFTWGLGTSGQLGSGAIISRSSPVQVGTSSYSQVSAGASHAGGIDTSNNIYTWGVGTSGQLGDNTIVTKSTPTKIGTFTSTIEYSPLQVGTDSWASVSSGYSHTLGIKSDNTVFAWGLNNAGQVGDISIISRSSPVQVGTVTSTLTNANAYSLYYDNAISGVRNMTTSTSSDWALGTDWTIEFFFYPTNYPSTNAWIIYQTNTPGIRLYVDTSNNLFLQADSSTVRFRTASSIPLTAWTHVAISSIAGTVVVYFNGVVQTLSLNAGNGSYNLTATDGITLFNRPSGGTTQTNLNGYISNLRIVNGTGVYTSAFTTPTTPLTAITNTVLLMAQNTTITTDNSGTSKVLTVNGTTPTYSLNTPFSSAIAPGALFGLEVSAGSSYSAMIDTTNKLYLWGLNNAGQLGLGDVANRSAPTQIITNNILFNNISAGVSHIIVTDTKGSLWAWGDNAVGQVGDNTVASRSSPTQIGTVALTLPNLSSPTQVGTSSWSQVSAGNNFTYGLSSANKLFVWGLGTTGQLGTGITISRSSPVQISTSSYSQLGAGGTHATFILNSTPQLLLGSGLNTSGQLGDLSIISRSNPVQINMSVTTFNSPVTVSVGNYSSYYVSSPTQVGSSSWTTVSAGGTHTLGVKSDNTLFAWGLNNNGQLGGSNTINTSSPVQIGSSSWSQVSAGDSHNTILKSDGTINTFGLNSFGQLGDGT